MRAHSGVIFKVVFVLSCIMVATVSGFYTDPVAAQGESCHVKACFEDCVCCLNLEGGFDCTFDCGEVDCSP